MSQTNGSGKRYPALDAIRLCALSMIPALHFFLNTGFYEAAPGGPKYWLALLIRTGLTVTVPLFIMMSGYLLCENTPRAGWWRGLRKILLIYVLSCVPAFFVRRAAEAGYAPSAGGVFWSVLDFELNPYAWYINLYIGLYLLSPFLNRMHQGLNRQWHGTLLLLLFGLVSLPTLVNSFQWFSRIFWRQPALVEEYNRILPDYWIRLPFAVMYYEAGAYVRYYPPKIGKRRLLLLLSGLLAAFTAYNAWRQGGMPFKPWAWIDYHGFMPAVLTPLTFCFLLSVFSSRPWKEKTVRRLAWLSELSPGAYLLSYCMEELIYKIGGFTYALYSFRERFVWFPVIVILGTLGSLLLSVPLTYIAKGILHWADSRKAAEPRGGGSIGTEEKDGDPRG